MNPSKGKGTQSQLRLNSRLLPLIVAVFAALYFFTGFRGWLILMIGSAGVWLLGFIWVISLRRNLHIERKLHLAWAMIGESVQEQIKLVNNSVFPAIWVEITDDSATLSTPIRLVSDIGSRSVRTRYFSHVCQRRGLYALGPTTLRTGDPFGIYTLTKQEPQMDTILVTPSVVQISQLIIPPGGWTGDQWRFRSAFEREISDAGVREYFPGDSLKRIHWSASAHTGNLIVRQLEAHTSNDWWIYVDLHADAQAGNGLYSTIEFAIVLAASIAIRGLHERHRVGLIFAGPDLVSLEPRSDPTHRWQILKALALAAAGEHSLADLASLQHADQTATMIAITPSTDPKWVATAGRNRSGNQVAILIDPTEFGGTVNHNGVIAALANQSIPFYRMSARLLKMAYPSLEPVIFKPGREISTRKRYFQQGNSVWQNID